MRTAFGRNDAELLSRMSRVALLWNAANPYPALVFKETERAAQTLGIEVQSLEVQEPNDFGNAFEAAERYQPDALIMVEDPLTIDFRKQCRCEFHLHWISGWHPAICF